MIPVQPPPAIYATGPLPADLNIIRLPTWQNVADYCAIFLGTLKNGDYQACYIPSLHRIVIKAGLAPADERRFLDHEEAHARGWRHPRPFNRMGNYR